MRSLVIAVWVGCTVLAAEIVVTRARAQQVATPADTAARVTAHSAEGEGLRIQVDVDRATRRSILDDFPSPIDRVLEPVLDSIIPAPRERIDVILEPPTSYDNRPGELEILAKLPKVRSPGPPFYQTERKNFQVLIQLIGEKVDPCKYYSLAGVYQLIRCDYKCTVYFDELHWADYPIPFNHVDHRVEVLYITKAHLRPDKAPAVRTDRAERPKTSTAPETSAESDLMRRLIKVEEKLDRILRALENPRCGPED